MAIILFKWFFSFVLIFIKVSLISSETFCGDWDTYKDEKCIKIYDLEKTVTYEEAVKSCSHLEIGSTPLTIHTAEEQDFISKTIFSTHKIADNIWLGLENSSNKFEWIDKTAVDFTNWVTGSPVHKTDYKCVEMAAESVFEGKWVEVLCNKKNIAVCQKPTYSFIRKLLIERTLQLNTCLNPTKNDTNLFKSSPFTDTDEKQKIFIFPLNENKNGSHFINASNICAKYNSKLIEIQTKEKQSIVELFLKQLYQKSEDFKYFWLNARKNSFGTFIWLNSGKDVTYSNWYNESKRVFDYIHIDSFEGFFGKWLDSDATYSSRAICEIEVNLAY